MKLYITGRITNSSITWKRPHPYSASMVHKRNRYNSPEVFESAWRLFSLAISGWGPQQGMKDHMCLKNYILSNRKIPTTIDSYISAHTNQIYQHTLLTSVWEGEWAVVKSHILACLHSHSRFKNISFSAHASLLPFSTHPILLSFNKMDGGICHKNRF